MSTDQHINESILNDEIREHQKENRTDHMAYLPDMENILQRLRRMTMTHLRRMT